MPLFLGYDPGGKGKHGVAAADIAPSGAFLVEPEVMTLTNAGEVREWLEEHKSALSLGIDTLLAWSPSGARACDNALRAHYPGCASTVVPQNSLYSAMTVNGILVAKLGQELSIPLVECHPKLLLKAALQLDPEGEEVALRYLKIMEAGTSKNARARADDMGDALVAAWCASRWHFQRWGTDLYKVIPEELDYPAGPAVYPWPETL